MKKPHITLLIMAPCSVEGKKIVPEKPRLFRFDNKPTLISIITLCDP